MTARRGTALLAAVWLTVAIGALALEVSWMMRTRRLATLNAMEIEQAQATALAGLEHARGQLVRALHDTRGNAFADPWRLTNDTGQGTLEHSAYVFHLVDDGARLDINRATEAMLARLFAACGADAPHAITGAARIADWRDADNVRRLHGAERNDYLARGARRLPADADIQSIDHLDGILERPQAWACARSMLTTRGEGFINPNTAPREVLRALPGVDDATARAIVDARRTQRLYNWRDVLSVVPPGPRAALEREQDALQRLLIYETRVIHVTSDARLISGSAHARVEALMQRMGSTVFTVWRTVE